MNAVASLRVPELDEGGGGKGRGGLERCGIRQRIERGEGGVRRNKRGGKEGEGKG